MKGDFTRDTFDPRKHFSRVLMQQGRVMLDADWNEQLAILLHRIETHTRDLVGPYGGPARECGFAILPDGPDGPLNGDFRISAGRYYVNGTLCENYHPSLTFKGQDAVCAQQQFFAGEKYLIYLDVWEDYVSAAEDPSIHEPALGRADTAGRAKVHWRVRAWTLDETWRRELSADPKKSGGFTNDKIDEKWPEIVRQWQAHHRGSLRVRVGRRGPDDEAHPLTAPAAMYRGTENHLYRIEVHEGGKAAASEQDRQADKAGLATFKWSRDNGSTLFPVAAIEGATLTLGVFGSDFAATLGAGDWIEVLQAHGGGVLYRGHLYQAQDYDPGTRRLVLKAGDVTLPTDVHGLLVRRWDQKERADARGAAKLRAGAVQIVEGEGEQGWIPIEDGIQIQFHRREREAAHYRSGDYWLVPARVADGGTVEWPHDPAGQPVLEGPRGITHHYAPLGIVNFNRGTVEVECASRVSFTLSADDPPIARL